MATAAFFDVDGTLVRTNVVHSYAYYAANLPSLARRLTRSARLAAALPLYFVAELMDRKLFNDLFYKNYQGISRDRLEVLGEEAFENLLRPAMRKGARDLVRRARDAGHLPVLVTGALDFVAQPLARHLEVEVLAANRLRFGPDGNATGQVERPVLAGPTKAHWITRWAQGSGIDLEGSFAYADSFSDFPMLSTVGHPAAVCPDFKLRQAARAHDWPVLEI